MRVAAQPLRAVVCTGRLVELDSLRGLAASVVLLFHVTAINDRFHESPWQLWWGHYGVELFFVISGFVILMTIGKSATMWEFVASRIARLYPANWCAVLLTSLCVIALKQSEPSSVARILANLTMFHAFMFMKISPIDGSYWTLTRELLFYLTMIAWFRFRSHRYPDIEWYALVWIAVVLLTRGLTQMFGRTTVPAVVSMALIMDYGQFFIVGMCLYRYYSGRYSRLTHILLIAACLMSLRGGDFKSLSPAPLTYFLVTCLIATLIWWAVRFRPKVLRNRVLLYLGSISYPLYLIHQRISADFINAAHALDYSWLQSAPLIVGSIVLLSYLLHIAVESPGQRLLRSALSGRRRGASQPSVDCDSDSHCYV
jgi:peptidoglycan/LPS O-acetylase OafA/YrhL